MTRAEVAALLAIIAINDNRSVAEADVIAWHALIGDLDYEDCRDAVVAHRRDSLDYLQPAHIRLGVRRIRTDRAERAPYTVPDADPDDVPAYLRALRTGQHRAAIGHRSIDQGQLARTFRQIPGGTA